ncbi:hypothetical protein NEF87_004847 [Candidatus Lokiarchaeum ossiferum]|uniref:Uncharacterized protein n=1 Tax=Candidatus Lokiarchaeum ossiferum TaxID=2951803 RepID=A0ABY6I1V7_9ARCH|nr:hypothetical protein NEF87_004847 [Candidatus Lokiarchaeum sp. B-35]
MSSQKGLFTKLKDNLRNLEITYDGEKIFSKKKKKNLPLSGRKFNHRKYIVEFPERKRSIGLMGIYNLIFSIVLFLILLKINNVWMILVLILSVFMLFLLTGLIGQEESESRLKIKIKNQKSFDEQHPDYLLNRTTRGSKEIKNIKIILNGRGSILKIGH